MNKQTDPSKEHQEWNRQHVFWLEDLDRWQSERAQARETLKRLVGIFEGQEAVYTRHRESMVALEQELVRHQHHLDTSTERAEDKESHEAARRMQEELSALHARLGAHHQAVLANIQSLQSLAAEFSQ